MKSLWFLAAGIVCLVLMGSDLMAEDAQPVRITPENMGQQDEVLFSVEGEIVGGVEEFVMRARLTEGEEASQLEAHLSIQKRGALAAVCPVLVEQVGNEAQCTFRVSEDYLDSSVLYIVDATESDERAPPRYWLHLKEFFSRADRVPTQMSARSIEPTLCPPGLNEIDWVTSDDSVLSLRLSTMTPVISRSLAMQVVVELRNNSEQAVAVLRPCGDEYGMLTCFVQIVGPDAQRVRYTGSSIDNSYEADAFVTLGPGEVLRCRIRLLVDNFAETGEAGEFEIAFHYAPDESYRTRAADVFGIPNVWVGEIVSRPVIVEKE